MTFHNRVVTALMLAGAFLMTPSCATAPKPPASTSRVKDSAPEKIAAQRAAGAHGLQVESDDGRWGIEAARERKRQSDEAKPREAAATPGTRLDVTPLPR
jgi:hypothetical protein